MSHLQFLIIVIVKSYFLVFHKNPPPRSQQPTEEVSTSNGLKCYMCGLVCPDERAFITHMRFHLFNYRYTAHTGTFHLYRKLSENEFE